MSQRQSRSGGRACQTIASFLLKTYEILDHPEFQHIISWEKDNNGFIVKDSVAFTKQILPKYFRHSNFSSFVRQLNMYDFHKVKQQNDNLVFKNPKFKRGEQHQLREIRRKASKKPFSTPKPLYHRQKMNSESQKYTNTLRGLKKTIEGEINQSCNLFEGSLLQLDQNNTSNHLKIKYLQEIKTDKLNLQSILKLKQECFNYFNKIESWIEGVNQSSTRKLKITSTYVQQLNKKEDNNSNNEKKRYNNIKNQQYNSR